MSKGLIKGFADLATPVKFADPSLLPDEPEPARYLASALRQTHISVRGARTHNLKNRQDQKQAQHAQRKNTRQRGAGASLQRGHGD